MVKKIYRAVFLDLFDTVVTFDVTRLPLTKVNGYEIHSTVPFIYEMLNEHWNLSDASLRYPLDEVAMTLLRVHQEITSAKGKDLKEISSIVRFERMLERLNISNERNLAARLTQEHMRHILSYTTFPYRDALEKIAERYPLALVSNFDHAEGGMQLLEALDLRKYFGMIVISDALGYIKPHEVLFQAPLKAFQLSPEQVLFVGDTPEADILGARRLGIDACWINRHNKTLPESCPEPTHIISDFSELVPILFE